MKIIIFFHISRKNDLKFTDSWNNKRQSRFHSFNRGGGEGGRSPKRLKDNSRNFQKENIFLLDLHNTICNPTTSMKWEKQLVKGFWMKESFF